MTAELLRRAAAKIRSTATLAKRELDGEAWDTTDPGVASDLENHIALWSPYVAEPVADWFDAIAYHWEVVAEQAEDPADPVDADGQRIGETLDAWAVDVARRILGESP